MFYEITFMQILLNKKWFLCSAQKVLCNNLHVYSESTIIRNGRVYVEVVWIEKSEVAS